MEKPAKVVIVDDSDIARETLVDLLAVDKHEFRHVQNGIALFALLDDYEPDVILLDVMMPGLDGYEVCRQLKLNPDWQHIPVILVTALDSRDALIQGLDAGADEFLSKPVNGAVLRARVRSMLRIKHQYDELERLLALHENLAAMMVHDMRSPLSTIILYLELMVRRNRIPADELAKTKRLVGEARRLDYFINDMLLLGKMENDRIFPAKQPCDLVDLLQQRIPDYKALALPRDITFAIEFPDVPVPLQADPNLLGRAIDNLINNSLKSSPSPGTIEIRITTEGIDGKAQLTIADAGQRIPEEYREDAFDKFSIAGLKQRGITRVGLPLAFAKMVIAAHDGSIELRNNEPAGVTFDICF